jgi:hypothetical protein
MTIASFCREQLLAHGPLSLDDLVTRAVDAGITRAQNPHASLLSVIRYREMQLLDDRWVTPWWLLEGRCLTAKYLPYARPWYSEFDADLGLMGTDRPTALRTALVDDDTNVHCVRVNDGMLELSTIPTPDIGTLEVAALAERLNASTPQEDRYGEQGRTALRAVAQLMVDDPSTFRAPLPPLSTWVPALVEDAHRREEEARRMAEWHEDDERRRRRQVVLDDCTAIDVEIAAERAGMSIVDWLSDVIDRALVAEQPRRPEPRDVVISLGDRRQSWR